MTKKEVISKIEHIGLHPRLGPDQTIPVNLVIREGYVEFEINEEIEFLVQIEFTFIPNSREVDWFYNSELQTFEQA